AVFEAVNKKSHGHRLRRIGDIHAFERLWIARSYQRGNGRIEAGGIEPLDRLWGDQAALRFRLQRVSVGQEVGQDHAEVQQDQHPRRYDGKSVFTEAPPDELPLRRNRNAFLDFGGDRCAGYEPWSGDNVGAHRRSMRIRGSIHTSSRSEINEPTTVRTLISR